MQDQNLEDLCRDMILFLAEGCGIISGGNVIGEEKTPIGSSKEKASRVR